MSEEEKVVEIKLENNRIIIEQMNKKIVNMMNLDESNKEFYNFACFEVLDREHIRYFPFNKSKYLNYSEPLPPLTMKSCVMDVKQGMDALNALLGSRLWKVWGQDDEKIAKELME